MHTFLSLGDFAVFHCMLCLFVSGSYWKTQVSSPVMICLRISGSSLIFSSMSSQNFTRFCFWPSYKILSTNLTHTLGIPRSCSKIFRTDSLFRLSSSDIIQTVNLRLLRTNCFILVMFSSVLVVEGRPVLWSSSTSRDPSQNVCAIRRFVFSTSHLHHKPL